MKRKQFIQQVTCVQRDVFHTKGKKKKPYSPNFPLPSTVIFHRHTPTVTYTLFLHRPIRIQRTPIIVPTVHILFSPSGPSFFVSVLLNQISHRELRGEEKQRKKEQQQQGKLTETETGKVIEVELNTKKRRKKKTQNPKPQSSLSICIFSVGFCVLSLFVQLFDECCADLEEGVLGICLF